MSYTLQPGLKEADEQVEAAEEQLKWHRLAFPRIEQSVHNKLLPETALTLARKQFDIARARLRDTEMKRDERRAGTSALESRIDLGAAPADGKGRRGIYRLKDDILTICCDESGQGRPE